ncbi:hypothetical protein [Streptomyces sp. NRRL S-1521]|uniref:hypothetical protein n=1 Tax=Streptomyces sp. NRRL S-1521 TaxID=1609100 RepID=UPI0007484F81|nr:hypothetical protein [Streptomyces sp. NRRL S-1521]KUL62698.1 hypothetical protein ADL30_04670 [Streptomyces sp. NRRL S-1521]
MPSQGQLELDVRALSEDSAVRALAVVVEERGLLAEASRCPWDDAELSRAVAAGDLAAYLPPGRPEATDGELARAALEYVASLDEDMASTVAEAVEYARSPMERVDPVSLSVTVLVVVLLQTEVAVKRDTRGRWSFTLHKRAMRDAALGRVFTALLSRLTGGK